VRAVERLDAAEAERARLVARASELEETGGTASLLVSTVEAERSTCRALTVKAREAVELSRAVEETARREHGVSEVRNARAIERRHSAEGARLAAVRRRDDAQAVQSEAETRRTALAANELEARAASTSAGEEGQSLDGLRSEAWDRLQEARDRLGRSRKGLGEAESDATRLRASERDLVGRADDVKADLDKVQTEVELLRRRADERYQMALPALLDRMHAVGQLELGVSEEAESGITVSGKVVEGVPPRIIPVADLLDRGRVQDVAARLEENRAALGRLGEVNLGAVEEYRDLAERHGELVGQREDLEASMRSIRSAIAKMNRTCRQRFRDAFDRINENFQVSYPRLVGGGSARLSLTEEEDLLETGVDIFVQPPGKRLQNLSLLSGGEKAMTAIALLIAVFQVKPSPFCVLDEVDAPLDEANGARFNEMLKDLCRLTQFIVITHNRKTMECADFLYGVTMAAPGVSRLVSVDL
jgi:chromosome segregation protein